MITKEEKHVGFIDQLLIFFRLVFYFFGEGGACRLHRWMLMFLYSCKTWGFSSYYYYSLLKLSFFYIFLFFAEIEGCGQCNLLYFLFSCCNWINFCLDLDCFDVLWPKLNETDFFERFRIGFDRYRNETSDFNVFCLIPRTLA